MNIESILGIISSILTIFSILAGHKWKKYKKKAREFESLIEDINKDIKDDKITVEEGETIKEDIEKLLDRR